MNVVPIAEMGSILFYRFQIEIHTIPFVEFQFYIKQLPIPIDPKLFLYDLHKKGIDFINFHPSI